MIRRVLAVLVCITIGMSIGGVLHARDGLKIGSMQVRTCEEINEDYMECDDDSACTRINGVWVCTANVPTTLN